MNSIREEVARIVEAVYAVYPGSETRLATLYDTFALILWLHQDDQESDNPIGVQSLVNDLFDLHPGVTLEDKHDVYLGVASAIWDKERNA